MYLNPKEPVVRQAKKPLFSCKKRMLPVAVAALLGASATAAAAPGLVMHPATAATTAPLPTQFFPAPKDAAIPGRYIVVLKDQADGAILSGSGSQGPSGLRGSVNIAAFDLARKVKGQVMMQYHSALRGFVVQMDQRFLPRLLADPRVKYVEQDQMMHMDVTQNGATWGIDRIDQRNLPLDNNYTYTASGAGVNAYVIDTGILTTHSDFGGRASGSFTAINDGNGTSDCNGHGTHVSGTVGSTTYGVAKNVQLHAVRVLDCQGSGANSGVIQGVDWVAQNRVRPAVANMSLGGGSSTALDNAVVGAINSGVVFAVAAGNSNSDACVGSPNRVAQALTVAASTITDARASFSSWGSCVNIFAPGLNILSTWNNGGTNTISGTSMASPHVAGAAAVYLETHPNDTPSQVNSALIAAASTGKISNPNGSPNRLLYDVFGGGTTPPPPPPPPPSTTVLQNGVPVTGLSGAKDAQQFFTLDVPSGTSSLMFQMSGGTGDADLYVRFGSDPTLSVYDCRPFVSGNSETCDITNIQTGTYHVMINGFSAYSGVSLVGNATQPAPPPPPPPPPSTTVLQNGVPVTGLSGAKDAQQFFTMDVPAGATNLSFAMSGGTGDADLYVRFGSDPTLSVYDCRPFVSGNNETCNIANVQAGTYHVMVNGFSAYSGASLTGSFSAPATGGTFFQNTANVTIPDASASGPGSADSTINVTRSGDSGSISVAVDIKHTYRGDLKITVIAPNGTSAVLKNTNSSDGVDNVIQSFTVNATGVPASGTWILRVSDNFQQDTGFIDAWSITFQ